MSFTRLQWTSAFMTLTLGLGLATAKASVDSIPNDPLANPSLLQETPLLTIPPGEAYLRGEAVLQHFSVPREPESQPLLDDLHDVQSLSNLKSRLPLLDLNDQSKRFTKSTTETLQWRVFRDRDSMAVTDFGVRLAPNSSPQRTYRTFTERLKRAARSNPPTHPLAGLRIALDPGHMGGDSWDERTGKFVRDPRGRKMSEGVMALQTALILERDFKAQGAEVLITHRSLGPVASIPLEDLDIQEWGRVELRQSTLQPWFQSLLEQAPAGPKLYDAFKKNANFKKVFSSASRDRYFILRADIDARAEMIERFDPDLTLVIHYDMSPPPGNPTGLNPKAINRTKAYVSGSFSTTEFASREDRALFATHLLDYETWDASVGLSRAVVGELKSELGIPFDPYGGSEAREVEPGVFSRNLALSRKLKAHPVSYLECMFYNIPSEFEALLRTRHPLLIDGKNYPYSDRLAQVAKGIRQGVIKFVASYH